MIIWSNRALVALPNLFLEWRDFDGIGIVY